jgi:protein NEDD1
VDLSLSSAGPDFPTLGGEASLPTSPSPVSKKSEFAALGMGTPLPKRRVSRNKDEPRPKGKGKVVEFDDVHDDTESESEHSSDDGDGDGDKESERKLSMQISPMRPPSSAQGLRNSGPAWAHSPLRQQTPPSPGLGSTSSAQDFLRNIVRDVMFEYHQETKAEMTGLHLDLMSMGRGWKRELRDVMDEYVGDLKDLREENQRLREENEKLRRGY